MKKRSTTPKSPKQANTCKGGPITIGLDLDQPLWCAGRQRGGDVGRQRGHDEESHGGEVLRRCGDAGWRWKWEPIRRG